MYAREHRIQNSVCAKRDTCRPPLVIALVPCSVFRASSSTYMLYK